MAGQIVDVTLRLVDKVTSPLNSLGSNLAKSANQWVRAGKQITNVGKSISSAGANMTKSLTVPIATAGAACVKLAADFESGMSKVQSICGATGEELNSLSEKAKEMGAKTKFSATEASDAFSYMAMAGWKTQDMLDGIEGIMYLAGASGEELATTSDIVTDALTAFGMSADETTRFVDVLAATASNSNTNVAMMGESFQYVAPIAGALKYSVEDVSVALGTMANSGIKASTAGTSLRSLLTNLSKPTDSMAAAMKKLGISLTDSSGNMKSLGTLMNDIRGSFAGLTESQKAQYAATLAGKTGMSGMLAIVNASQEDFDKLTNSINSSSGACKEMYDVANDNLTGQLTVLKSTTESIAISFGERMTPYVKQLTAFIQKLADKFNGLSDAQKDTIIKVGLVVASIGPALLIFGKLTMGIGSVVTTIGKVGKAFKTFGSISAMLASPAGIVVASLTAIALGAALIIKNWDKIKPVLMNVKKWFVESFGGAGGAFEQFKGAMTTVMEAISPVISSIQSWFGENIPKAINFFTQAFNTIKPIVQDVIIKVINGAANVISKLAEEFSKAVPKIVSFVNDGIKKIQPVLNIVVNLIKKAIPVIGTALVKAFDLAEKAVKVIAPMIKNVLGAAFKFIIPIIKTAIEVIKDVANNISSKISESINKATPILNTLSTVFTTVFGVAKTVFDGFVSFAGPKVTAVIGFFGKIGSCLLDVLQPVFQMVFKNIGTILNTFVDVASKVINTIIGVLGGITTFLSGVFTGNWTKAWSGVKSIFSSIFGGIAGIAKSVINGVIGIINNGIGALNKFSVDIPEEIPGIGGKHIGLSIPKIPTLAVGTNDWKGGIAQISERGGEIVDLPNGTRVYPHDNSVSKAYTDGAASIASRMMDVMTTLSGTINDSYKSVVSSMPKNNVIEIKTVASTSGATGSSRNKTTTNNNVSNANNNITINIPKLADTLTVRSDKDIDIIAKQLANNLEKVALNIGGGQIASAY